MRKVVVSQFVSLDGVVEDPSSWTFQFFGEEQQKYKLDELAAADVLLLGRVTYEEFAAAWPKMMEQYEGPGRAELGEYADMMNGYPKFVVSTTLREAEWNNSTVITGNVADEVSRLKQQPGKDILVFGSTELVNALVRHGLVDEFRLMVFPIVLGGGGWWQAPLRRRGRAEGAKPRRYEDVRYERRHPYVRAGAELTPAMGLAHHPRPFLVHSVECLEGRFLDIG